MQIFADRKFKIISRTDTDQDKGITVNRVFSPFSRKLSAWIVAATLVSIPSARADDAFPSQPITQIGSWSEPASCAETLRCTGGTLFRWGNAPHVSGGPNLDEPLVTDRPDFTEASVTVGRGVSQLEFGYTYLEDDNESQSLRSHSYGEFLLRHGMFADWFELRVGFFPQEQKTQAGGIASSTAGVGDLYLGAKLALTPQHGILPEMALIPQAFLPTGSSAFTSGHFEPGANLIYGWEINDIFSTAGSTQGNRRQDDSGESFLELAQSWTVGYTLTEELRAYTEWFAFFSSGSREFQTQHYFNGGFTYLINDDLQWDIRAGVGLNGAADDFFTGTGLSIRFR